MEKIQQNAYQARAIDETSQAMVRRRPNVAVVHAPFAGRLGGNQEFIADSDTDSAKSLLEKQPDAAPLSNIRSSLQLEGFLSPDLWRVALLEGWGTFLLVSLLGAMSSGLTTQDQPLFAQVLYAALAGSLGLALFTYALAPVTGAHLNPVITMATFFAGLSTLPRTVLYIAAQSIGGLVAGGWLRLGLGEAYFPIGVIPGCTVDPTLVSPGQLFVLEYTFCQILIFIAFGVGLDPRQGKTIGPTFAPALIGVVLGLGNLASALAKPGYSGMSFNPARCLGLMTAKEDMQYHYIHWLAPLAATVFNAVLYHLAPPWTKEAPFFSRFTSWSVHRREQSRA